MESTPHYADPSYITGKIASSDRIFGRFDLPDRRSAEVERTYNKVPWTFVACPSHHSRCRSCGSRPAHVDAIVIAVDGVSVKTGGSAVGVYIHEDNEEYNDAFTISSEEARGKQYAALMATLRALEIVQHIRNRNLKPDDLKRSVEAGGRAAPVDKLSHVVIKTDYELLYTRMTELIFRWKNNGYRNSKKKPLAFKELYIEIDETIMELNRCGVQVEFLLVRQMDNAAANILGRTALDGHSVADAMAKRKTLKNAHKVEYHGGQVVDNGSQVLHHSCQVLEYYGQVRDCGDTA